MTFRGIFCVRCLVQTKAITMSQPWDFGVSLFQFLQSLAQAGSDTDTTETVPRLEGLHDQSYRTAKYERTILEGASDPKQIGHLSQRPEPFGTWSAGRITYSLPYAGWYRVQLENLGSELPCCRASTSSFSPPSTQDCTVLPPGEEVLVYQPFNRPYGIIVAAIPQLTSAAEINFGDQIVQASNGGFPREGYFRDLLNLTESGVLDFSLGNPIDGGALGEFTQMSPLGLSLHLGAFLAHLRVDETCGLFLHYFNKYARLAGFNFDWRTSISECQVRQDQGEAYWVQGYAGYPWEALGFFTARKKAHRVNDDADVLYSLPEAKHEPKTFSQAPFWRMRDYSGYLGQGFLRELVLPPTGSHTRTEPWHYGDSGDPIGVFKQHTALNGAHLLATAHSFTLVKRMSLPVPVQLKLPEDPTGDTEKNYRFSDINGGGPDTQPVKIAEPDFERSERRRPYNLLWPNAWLEFQQFGVNWRSLHQFYYHTQDWRVREDADDGQWPIYEPPDFTRLLVQPDIPPPKPWKLFVDHRQESVDYYPTCSGFSILPNGYLVFQGPAGEQLVLGGGNIRLSCPGDIELMPGRRLVSLAGDDTILRSQKSVDITSALGDVRLKAQYNMELLAGNSGSMGRLLLETKSRGQSHYYRGQYGEEIQGKGLILRADDSEIVAYGGRIYQHSTNGPIYLDAGHGSQPVIVLAESLHGHFHKNVLLCFPASKDPDGVYLFEASSCRMPGSLTLGNSLTVMSGGAAVTGNVSVRDGHIASTSAGQFNGQILAYNQNDPATQQLQQYFQEQQQQQNQLEDFAGKLFENFFEKSVMYEYQAGSSEFLADAHFSLRTEEQYGTKEDHPMICPLWQVMVEGQGLQSAFSTWEEPSVRYQARELRPFPGHEAWSGDNLHTIDWQLIDPSNGTGKDRHPDQYGQGDIFKTQAPRPCSSLLTVRLP